MKLLILSDSHGTLCHMTEAIEAEHPDYVIHLGDHMRDAEELQRQYPLLPILSVKGNCDFGPGQEQAMAEYGGIRILAAHGHRYGVKSGLLRYFYAAKENQVDVALFGHTHLPYCEAQDGLWLLNPGSCGASSRPTYGIIEIQNKTARCTVKTLEDGRSTL